MLSTHGWVALVSIRKATLFLIRSKQMAGSLLRMLKPVDS
jgi:hypothetical protein